MRVIRLIDRLLAERTNARTAAVVRIAIAVAAVLVWLEEAPVLWRLTDPNVLRVPYVTGMQLPDWLFTALAGVWPFAAVALAIGLRTRLAAGGLALTAACALAADQQLYSNHLYLLLLAVILIGMSQAGAAVSLDARGQPERESIPGWPLGLIRVQVSLVYAFAAVAKLNPTYLSGTVIGAYLRDSGPLAVPDEWRSFEVLFVLSLLSILFEAFLAVALWLPRWRRTAFAAGLMLHSGVAIWLEPTGQLITFGFLILPLYLTFLDVAPRSVAVVWDDQCTFCRGWVTWATRLDWLHALQLVPASDAIAVARRGVRQEDALIALQVVTNNRTTSGYDAVARIAGFLPISFLWAPLLRLSPIAAAGRRVYRRVAERRACGVRPSAAIHTATDAEPADVVV